MNVKPAVFVSYTMRDGLVSEEFLHQLHSQMREVCEPFIHAIVTHHLKYPQLSVLRALFRSRLVILLESPMVYSSPWVRLELFLSHLKALPVVRLPVADIVLLSNQPNNGLLATTNSLRSFLASVIGGA